EPDSSDRRAPRGARARRAAARAARGGARRHRDRARDLARAQAAGARGRAEARAGGARPAGRERARRTPVNAVAHVTTAARSTARPPPILFLADHLGFPSGRVHGVTTYLVDVLPSLKASGVDVAACFLKAAHPAAQLLREHGIPVHFLDTRRFNPFVVRSVGD